jgi:hypothetical protein
VRTILFLDWERGCIGTQREQRSLAKGSHEQCQASESLSEASWYGKFNDRLDGNLSVSIFVMGTSPSEANDSLKLGQPFREIAGFEGSTIVDYKRLFKFWYIDSFL